MRYLDTDLNVALMCTMYNEWMQDNHPTETIMKECIYRQVFKEFRLSFKPPMTDTCSRCDELKVVITTSTRNKDERQKAAAEEALKDHQDLAARGHRLMKKLAQESADDVRVVCVDLQQTLPIPRLPTSVAYYKMKLWMYNLAVTNLKTGQSTCFVWDEVTGGRGSSEVATCLGQWVELEKAKGNFEKLVVFSDNCGGQNKNIIIILSYMSVIHSGALKKVDHYYLVPGHSYMACDRAFGLIEKRIRAKNMIYSFEDYCTIIRQANTKTPNAVERVQRMKFVDYDTLQRHITHRKPTGPYSFSGARHFSITHTYLDGYFLGMDYESPLASVNLKPARVQRGQFNLSATPLPVKYAEPRRLQAGKVKHLEDLAAFIPPPHNQYLLDIVDTQRQTYAAPSAATPVASTSAGATSAAATTSAAPEDLDSDVDNDLLEYDDVGDSN